MRMREKAVECCKEEDDIAGVEARRWARWINNCMEQWITILTEEDKACAPNEVSNNHDNVNNNTAGQLGPNGNNKEKKKAGKKSPEKYTAKTWHCNDELLCNRVQEDRAGGKKE